MGRLEKIARCMAELETARKWYGVQDSNGEKFSRMVWECDQLAELHWLLYEDLCCNGKCNVLRCGHHES